jgi:hypothetical protein
VNRPVLLKVHHKAPAWLGGDGTGRDGTGGRSIPWLAYRLDNIRSYLLRFFHGNPPRSRAPEQVLVYTPRMLTDAAAAAAAAASDVALALLDALQTFNWSVRGWCDIGLRLVK